MFQDLFVHNVEKVSTFIKADNKIVNLEDLT